MSSCRVNVLSDYVNCVIILSLSYAVLCKYFVLTEACFISHIKWMFYSPFMWMICPSVSDLYSYLWIVTLSCVIFEYISYECLCSIMRMFCHPILCNFSTRRVNGILISCESFVLSCFDVLKCELLSRLIMPMFAQSHDYFDRL